jgi:phage shock protein A
MSFFGRLKDIFSASAHGTLEKMEDPEKMANEYLRQLNDQYYEAKTRVAQAMADETRLQQKWTEAQKEVDKYQGMAETALRSNREDLAKQALQRKAQAQKIAQQYEQQYHSQDEQVDKLQEALADLETKIGETKARRDLIVAKKNRAKTQEAIHSTVSNMQSDVNVIEKLDRLEERIDDQLAKSEAMAQLQTDSLDQQFQELESESGVDSELAELKKKMGM